MNRISLLSAALTLLAAPAFAGGQNNSAPNSAPNHPNTMKQHEQPAIGPGAPNVSTALSTALSVGGTDNLGPTITPGDGILRKPTVQYNSAPAVQAGVAVGIAIDGNASAEALNHNGAAGDNAR